MLLNGRVGQVLGPFAAGVDLLDNGGAISETTPETTRPILFKLGIQAAAGTVVKINGASIKIGSTGIYELDTVVNIRSLVFPSGAAEGTIIDFCY